MNKIHSIALVAAMSLSVPELAAASAARTGSMPTMAGDDGLVLVQTQGMDRRQERREERQARRADRREKLQIRIDCGATDIILEEEQAEGIAAVTSLSGTTNEEVAAALCDLVKDVDASGYDRPTNSMIELPNGTELFVELQASQQ